jgi:hypothetical protein
MSAPEPRRRWSAPVAVPADLSCLRGPTTGTVTLPYRLYWSGTGGPRTLDLTNPAERDLLYSIVLTEGTEGDVCTLLNAELLAQMWPTLWLSPHVREAWAPLLDRAA